MDFALAGMKEDLAKQLATIRELGLMENLAELAAQGYTVVPPEKVAPSSDIAAARDRLLEIARDGGAFESGESNFRPGFSYTVWLPLVQGNIFEKFLLNPAALALSSYLLGSSMVLNNSLGFVKGRSGDSFYRIHTDSLMIPDPFPPYAQIVNCTFMLTDYTLERGCIGIVPGSHRYLRHPTADEEKAYELLEPIEAPAGSLLILPAYTWHGAFPNLTDDTRVTLVQAFSRIHITPSIDRNIPQDIIERNPDRFAKLLGRDLITGFGTEGPQMSRYEDMYMIERNPLS
ncbi:phytanoyl-CoA dioxygenase family protein [Aquisediminimonas profunda]|uniref:phytanoyl-CoA dioxygenase family protein n=1 Tax=Aquisediminimonas profunda TaxID=1550733 RepID=UPI001C62AAFF|nr:phytanoyl-CoA dioxygenase family protein [Aquisediminimonas profunda]